MILPCSSAPVLRHLAELAGLEGWTVATTSSDVGVTIAVGSPDGHRVDFLTMTWLELRQSDEIALRLLTWLWTVAVEKGEHDDVPPLAWEREVVLS
jgi:hypothetical protein